jgi:hypothetical protein
MSTFIPEFVQLEHMFNLNVWSAPSRYVYLARHSVNNSKLSFSQLSSGKLFDGSGLMEMIAHPPTFPNLPLPKRGGAELPSAVCATEICLPIRDPSQIGLSTVVHAAAL